MQAMAGFTNCDHYVRQLAGSSRSGLASSSSSSSSSALLARQLSSRFATTTRGSAARAAVLGDRVGSDAAPAGIATNGANPLLVAPEDFVLPPGELSHVDRESKGSAADKFTCAGCTLAECQGPTGCAANAWRYEPGGYLRQILTARVYDVAVETPLELAPRLSEAAGCRLWLKREDLQPVFSFKLRGAYNKMASLTREQRERGVICSSAGNHAQGVALAASKLGCAATICMPLTTPEIKVAAVRRLGGTVQLVGESYQEAQAAAQAASAADGRVFVAPYDDPHTISGQGTIGAEIIRQLGPRLDDLEAVFVAVGGGGLIAGIGAYVKALKPSVKVIGVEPVGANAMAQSLARGERVTLSKVDAFADGVAVKQVGAETFRLCRELVDGVILVDNGAVSGAIKDVFNETRCILEPAGAVSVAGAKAYAKLHGLPPDACIVAVTSGANMNFDRLRLVSELADVGARQEAMLATTIPESPGAFKDFVDTAMGDTERSFTEFKYRYEAGPEAQVLFSVAVRDAAETASMAARLCARGFATTDLSGVEAAQVHLRHLVGGRARSYMGRVPFEQVYQVEFPERPGALRRFLDAVSPTWNVTLFHYRSTGNRTTTVLVGLQVPPADEARFREAVGGPLASDGFSVERLPEEVEAVFAKFIS